MKKLKIVLAVFLLIPSITLAASSPSADNIEVRDGYIIEPIVSNLSVPTTIIFDNEDMLIAESGFVDTAKPRVLRIKPDGTVTVVASQGLEGPVTGLLVHNNQVYVSHKGKVSIVQEDGSLRDIVTGLPSNGDHQNNQIVMGVDGRIYMGQGTVTNAGVVGEDNHIFGWLKNKPEEHDVPCKDITLVGQNFETGNPLTEDNDDKAVTGAYKPFGTPSIPNEVIKGNPKCGGSIVSFNPDGSDFRLIAWGLRNPFGLDFDLNNQLWASYHGADVRGSRNIYNDPDYLVKVEQDAWYGFPDYFDGRPVTENRFKDPTKPKPQFLWKEHPTLTSAFATFDSHTAINGIAFSKSSEFGFEGDLFIAAYGTFAPVTTGSNLNPIGFRVLKFDPETKETEDFAANELPGPAYLNGQNGFDRPSDVAFGPDNALYVADWGGSRVTEQGLEQDPGTGVVWRIYPENGQALRPNGPIVVPADPVPESQSKALAQNVPETYKMLAPQLALAAILLIAAVLLLWYAIRRFRRR